MTGILGVVRWDGAGPAESLAAVLPSLAYWGPEGGVWAGAPAALAFRNTSGDNGLLHDPVSNRTLVADLRLDNADELREALRSGADPQPLGSLELVLRAYERWGRSSPDHLLGDFAFAIWDGRSQALFCARDMMGVRPFYYAERPGLIVFASDIRTVLALPGLQTAVDLRFIADLVQARGDSTLPCDRTAYQGIFRLPPATTLLAAPGKTSLDTYWRAVDTPGVDFKSDGECLESLRHLLEKAVACRLGRGEVGAHLSGGLDSSLLTVIASQQLAAKGKRLATYSWAPPPRPGEPLHEDERRLVEQVRLQESLSVEYTEVSVRDVALTRLRNVGQFPTAGYFHEASVRRRAAQRGLNVLLSGWGGDELISFNGRGYWADLFRRGRWITLHNEMLDRGRLFGRNDRRGAWQNFKRTVLPLWIPQAWLRRYRPELAALPAFMPRSIRPDLAAKLRGAGPLSPRLGDRAGVRENQLAQLGSGLIVARLEAWASNAAPYGFEYRFPLLDRRVVEFSLGLSPRMYLRSGWDRFAFRKVAAGRVPEAVAWALDKAEPATYAANRRVVGAWRREVTKALDDLLAAGATLRCIDGSAVRYVREGGDALETRFQEVRLAAAIVGEILLDPGIADRLIDAFPGAR